MVDPTNELQHWRVVGASVTGFLHLDKGLGCDDAHGWSVREGSTILVVADGAGSRPGTSAIGAHVAVAAVLDAAADPDFVAAHAAHAVAATSGLVERAVAAVSAEAVALGIGFRALATTLCLAVLAGDRITVAQIGDGVAVVERANGAIEAVAIPEHFEYANEAVFLTADDALDHLKIFTATEAQVRSVALSTDGLRYKVLDDPREGRPFAPFFVNSWAYARSERTSSAAIESFLLQVDDQTGDDKTLLLAVSDFAGGPGEPDRLTDRPMLPKPPAFDGASGTGVESA